jgi:L-fuculose-phosphate aldolase
MTDASLRNALADAARRTVALGLNHGTTGNLSVRTQDGFLITPTRVPCDAIAPDQLVSLDLDGRVVGSGEPSSEWRLHRAIYRSRPDARAVVHAHPPFSTTLACLRRELPAVHYLIAVAGGAVRCSAYEPPGTEALGQAALSALEGRRACLLANHGLVALGETPQDALAVAVEVECLAEVYWRAVAVGQPVLLTDAEVKLVAYQLSTYSRGTPVPDLPVS